ncbi:MAG: glycoside hydrolase family 28 protein [Bdellovibrionota bacterium]
MVSRRCFLKSAAALTASLSLRPAFARTEQKGWNDVPRILSRISPPRFPKRTFRVKDFGAVGDGVVDCAPSFRNALERCSRSGGGTIRIPRGTYRCNGPIRLLSNIHLQLDDGAEVRFGGDATQYLPPVQVRWEGTRCLNYSPMIYAHGARNIAITGNGTIDGGAERFESWLGKQEDDQTLLRRFGRDVVPVSQRAFGANHFLRPGLFEAYGCRNVLLDGSTFKNSPFWTLHPVFCSNVIFRNLTVLPGLRYTDDGIDPDSCRDMLIERCQIQTNDDQIAIKSGRDAEGRNGPPCENIIVRNCTLSGGKSGAIAVGSEMSGGVRNIFIERCAVPDGEVAIHLKSNTDRGGVIEDIWVRNLSIGRCKTCIRMETDYHKVGDHDSPASYRNLHFDRITCESAEETALSIVGREENPITGLEFSNIHVRKAKNALELKNTAAVSATSVTANGVPIVFRN